jgi:hypothetical protein
MYAAASAAFSDVGGSPHWPRWRAREAMPAFHSKQLMYAAASAAFSDVGGSPQKALMPVSSRPIVSW